MMRVLPDKNSNMGKVLIAMKPNDVWGSKECLALLNQRRASQHTLYNLYLRGWVDKVSMGKYQLSKIAISMIDESYTKEDM